MLRIRLIYSRLICFANCLGMLNRQKLCIFADTLLEAQDKKERAAERQATMSGQFLKLIIVEIN